MKDNKHVKNYYWIDIVNLLFEEINYYDEMRRDFEDLLNIHFTVDEYNLEDDLMDNHREVYNYIYHEIKGKLLSGHEYRFYLVNKISNQFKTIVTNLSDNNNADDFFREIFEKEKTFSKKDYMNKTTDLFEHIISFHTSQNQQEGTDGEA